MSSRSIEVDAESAPQKAAGDAIQAGPNGPNGAEPIIAASGVHKTYAGAGEPVHALRGVTLSVARGEMVTIMGPSGCGKTTLLNCLSGLETIERGEIFVEGRSIHDMPDNERTDHRARRMGFVFQFYNLLPVLSAVENVELPLLLAGLGQGEARDRSMEALEQVGLRDWSGHRPAQLSGGQRQRVTIARALVNDPAIVWGDEPTGDLDSTNANQIMELLEDLNRRNHQTFVIVTHDENIGRRANRTIHMRDGLIEGETIHRQLGS
ncbi:MAG: ABC transporter ATP-binding protein [Chloroflexota bacterium]|nr:ABC transporter ATP-binding protein [Chloroflexota bacterium]MDE2895958.1 ABC transporter ATP-binding protein [Chloroflexota bacterium]